MFHQISKHLEVVSKDSAAPRFFNLRLSVWISGETRFLVFDILLQKFEIFENSLFCQKESVAVPFYLAGTFVQFREVKTFICMSASHYLTKNI